MKSSKIMWAMMLAAVLGMTAMGQELRLNGIYVKPGDDKSWENAAGAEVSGTLWLNQYFGILGSVGVENWAVNEDENSDGFDTGRRWSGRNGGWIYRNLPVYRYDLWETKGSATVVPIGISGVAKIPVTHAFNITFEGGVKYLFVNSNVNIEGGYQEAAYYMGRKIAQGDVYSYETEVDVDNGVIGIIAGDCNFALTEAVSINVGGGYRFDLLKLKAEADGFESEDIESKGAFVRAGVSLKF